MTVFTLFENNFTPPPTDGSDPGRVQSMFRSHVLTSTPMLTFFQSDTRAVVTTALNALTDSSVTECKPTCGFFFEHSSVSDVRFEMIIDDDEQRCDRASASVFAFLPTVFFADVHCSEKIWYHEKLLALVTHQHEHTTLDALEKPIKR